MRRTLVLAASFAFVAAGTGCASSGTSGGTAKVHESSPDYVTSTEIEATSGAQNALDLVRRLRPRWLQGGTGAGSISGGSIRGQSLLVYLDGNRLGTAPDALRTLTVSGIKSMRFYDATRAPTVLREIGSEPIAGAIVISTTQQ